jgi:hypothetical protein
MMSGRVEDGWDRSAEGVPPVESKDELDAVCEAATAAWGICTKVEVVRDFYPAGEAKIYRHYWRVCVYREEGAQIEVTHPDRKMALGMAMAAITVEGL